MLYTDMNTPSANMNLPMHQIQEMLRAQNEEIFKAEEDAAFREQSQINRATEEYANYVNDYITSKNTALNNRAQFLEGVKSGLLNMAMMKLYTESFSHKMNERDKVVAKNLISKFIQEQGTGELLNRFKYQNTLIAEMGRMVQEAYDKIVDSINEDRTGNNHAPGEVRDIKFNTTIVDDFYKDIAELDTAEASQLIRDRVADAMSDFVDQNMQNRLDFQEVIDQAKEKIQDAQDESFAEATMNEAKRKINEMRRTRSKNIFHYMVEAISKQAYKDENLNKRYIHENTVDMDGIVNSAELIYTMLEMLNTTEMVDQDYIKNYIISLTEV